ncbi:MAG: glycerophosphodiester phosphodiesterase [Promethearchaeota archaeon]
MGDIFNLNWYKNYVFYIRIFKFAPLLMIEPYIFGHRGAMGYCIENTMPCFKKAVEFGAGIEADLQLTKDNQLICFHDYYIELNLKRYNVKNLTLYELKSLKFNDNREIPTAIELIENFKHQNHLLRFSFDIRDNFAGYKLIDLTERLNMLKKIEITERRFNHILHLRRYNKEVKIVHTLPEIISKINEKTVNFDFLKEVRVDTINIISWRATFSNFREIINNSFKCYVWGVNSKTCMKRVLNLKYKQAGVNAIYSDYPDLVINLRDKIKG